MLRTFIDLMKENGFKLAKERSWRFPAQTITHADYADDIVLLANSPAQTESLQHSLEWAADGIVLHVNADKIEYICFNQRGNISTLIGGSLKLVDKFTFIRICVSSTKNDINTWLAKAWTAIDRLSVIWKSYLSNKLKRSFFQAAVVSIVLYRCTTWTLIKRMEKKLDSNYIRMLQTVLNKTGWQHPTKQQLYGHLRPITKTILFRRTRHAGHGWRSKDELISDVLLWTPSQERAKVVRLVRTYIQQLCVDTRCSLKDQLGAMDDRDEIETWAYIGHSWRFPIYLLWIHIWLYIYIYIKELSSL